ncbi:putative sodium/calcium exchanger 7 isoform X2 [Drosophila montana]|uniref:putative sodium/calcium exchanger 7 isoform X2 n=1 Tax=Drosophila montana TaxID=40370 RepID=UPI00313B3B5C
MDIQYKPNILDTVFDEFWNSVNCYVVLDFPYDQRCEFVKKANSCVHGTNVVPYMHLLACNLKCKNQFEEMVYVTLFLLFSFEFLICLGHVVHYYYTPALKVVSRMLRMNEHLAGVTILAVGNTLPDLFANLLAIKEKNVPIFANSIAVALFVVMFVGGLVCYISPFEMNPYNTVRDLLFFILGLQLVEFMFITGGHVTMSESVVLIVVYLLYLIVNVLDLYLMRIAMQSIKREIDKLNEEEQTPGVEAKHKLLLQKYNFLARDDRVELLHRRSNLRSSVKDPTFTYMTRRMSSHSRINLKDKSDVLVFVQSRNRHLFKEFFLALNPFHKEDWRKANVFIRAFLIARAPVAVLCAIYIPLVDYELEKNGWTKALVFRDKSKLWYRNIADDVKYGLYSLAVTVPIAIVVFFHSKPSAPPSYHWIFTIMNLTGSIFLMFQCVAEISLITEVIGNLMKVPSDFMGATTLAVASGLADLVTTVSMALQGYQRMAYAAVIGGPFFSIILGTASAILGTIFSDATPDLTMIGVYGENALIMLRLGLLATLLWTSVLNYNARRSVGVFSMAIYCLFLLFAVLIKEGIIHSYDIEDMTDGFPSNSKDLIT